MKKILINDSPWQVRIAIMRDGDLQNIYYDTHSKHSLERSFFKGMVSKVIPGIQTAFVDIGQPKAGFLHISEIDRELAITRMGEQLEEIEVPDIEKVEQKQRKDLDIRKILKEGEPILVQVSKEPVYEKGAKLTTCFTLPGRFLVLMPNIPRIGISKKIEEKEERQRLRELVQGNLPEGMGAIIRTSCEHKPEYEILRDLTYLVDIWNLVLQRYQNATPEEMLYEDIDVVLQVIRDNLDNDVDVVLCDTLEMQQRVHNFVGRIAPEYGSKIVRYDEKTNIFERFNLEKQIEQALCKKVFLKSGGSIIVETTEAMAVIDVNTGRYVGQGNLEDTIFKTNLEAAEEIVRQLRLRNIGGLIVIDFIDMASSGNRQKLFKFLERTLKERDKFQSVVLRVSEFGLVQMTRKRSGKTLMQQLMDECQDCHGLGMVKSVQTEAFGVLYAIKNELSTKRLGSRITVTMHPAVLRYITSTEYNTLLDLEKNYSCKIICATHGKTDITVFSIESV